MAYKRYRIRKTTLVTSFVLIFLIGFFLAYNIANMQNNFFKEAQTTTYGISQAVKNTALTGQELRATNKVLAVSPKGDGVVGEVTVEIVPGDGKVLVNTNPFLEPDTQYSAVIAVEVAKKLTGQELKDKNVIITFDINGTVLGGPSAGAAMTVATVAAIEDKPIKQGVAITGTINEDGTIGRVGGILEKGEAAADNGYKTLLIPQGQTVFTYYEKQTTEKEVGGFVFYTTKLVPKTVDLKEHFEEERGMNVIEVNSIEDVVHYML